MKFPKIISTYQKQDRSNPFAEWFYSIPENDARARIRLRLDRLRFGNMGDCQPVGDGVHELRIHFGPGFRVYFGNDGDKIVVLLCGGDKSTQRKDIEKAKVYWED